MLFNQKDFFPLKSNFNNASLNHIAQLNNCKSIIECVEKLSGMIFCPDEENVSQEVQNLLYLISTDQKIPISTFKSHHLVKILISFYQTYPNRLLRKQIVNLFAKLSSTELAEEFSSQLFIKWLFDSIMETQSQKALHILINLAADRKSSRNLSYYGLLPFCEGILNHDLSDTTINGILWTLSNAIHEEEVYKDDVLLIYLSIFSNYVNNSIRECHSRALYGLFKLTFKLHTEIVLSYIDTFVLFVLIKSEHYQLAIGSSMLLNRLLDDHNLSNTFPISNLMSLVHHGENAIVIASILLKSLFSINQSHVDSAIQCGLVSALFQCSLLEDYHVKSNASMALISSFINNPSSIFDLMIEKEIWQIISPLYHASDVEIINSIFQFYHYFITYSKNPTLVSFIIEQVEKTDYFEVLQSDNTIEQELREEFFNQVQVYNCIG